MKITRITIQKKNKHRYNIFVDQGAGEEYGFSVDEDVLVQHHLRKGVELTDEMVDSLKKQDDLQKVYHQVIHYLSYRMRSEKEVRDYLQKKDVDEIQIDEIIAKLRDSNLVDDLEFAEMFVRTRMRTSTKGPGLIRQELRVKGIESTIANEALRQLTFDHQVDQALKFVKKRLNRSNNNSFRKQLDQARAALMRNGYESEVIGIAIDEVADQQDSDEEWKAIEYHGLRLERRHKGKFSEGDLRQKIKEGLYRQGFSLGLIHKYLETRS